MIRVKRAREPAPFDGDDHSTGRAGRGTRRAHEARGRLNHLRKSPGSIVGEPGGGFYPSGTKSGFRFPSYEPIAEARRVSQVAMLCLKPVK
jgi:hypothetical protein